MEMYQLQYFVQVACQKTSTDGLLDDYDLVFFPDSPTFSNEENCLENCMSIAEVMREDALKRVYGVPLMIREVPDAHRKVCMTAAFD